MCTEHTGIVTSTLEVVGEDGKLLAHLFSHDDYGGFFFYLIFFLLHPSPKFRIVLGVFEHNSSSKADLGPSFPRTAQESLSSLRQCQEQAIKAFSVSCSQKSGTMKKGRKALIAGK